MSHGTKFPVSEELQAAFDKCEKETRTLIVGIDNETLVLKKKLTGTNSPQDDLEAIAGQWDENEAAFFLFKEKQWGPSNWILIAFIPDSGPVQQRTIYGSAIMHLKQVLGNDKFASDKRYSELKEMTWNHLKGLGGGSADKPWSKRELAQQELNGAEATARQEAQAKPASGFHTASYPLTSEATAALDQLKSGSVNWVQLSLDASRKNMTSVVAKTASASELPSLIDEKEPQFYLYNASGNQLVLVYCCPENAPQKNRMVYSTCKASLADALKSSAGVSIVKKYDIREASEMNSSALNEALRSASSSLFKPDERSSSPVTRSSSYGSGSSGAFDHSNFQGNKAVFNRPGLSHAHSSSDGGSATNKAAKPAQLKAPAPLAQAMGLGSNSGKKSIVLPPRGAYE
jgi:twinfilin-like protein